MNKLADVIAEKVFNLLLEKQGEFDQQFIKQIEDSGADIEVIIQQDVFGNERHASIEEQLLAEMAKLMTLLQAYEEREQYEKAAIIKNKIEKLQIKLDKL